MQQNAAHMEVLRLLMEENVDASSFNYGLIVGILICMENIKALYRYYAHNIGAMIPFIGGVLLLVGIGTILDKSLNYKMVTVSFDIAFVYWPLMIIRRAILWIISKNSVWYIVKSYFSYQPFRIKWVSASLGRAFSCSPPDRGRSAFLSVAVRFAPHLIAGWPHVQGWHG